ncbi:glutathione synthetase-like [Ceratina calcarata]|uniref:Glutathione synthetase n=1 Tax=Ceratina calcarata TaxID=156304 RepID=A0AAJ7SCE3_9HYME|nr:glutathione synthetase-like [Ceratina calcarata]
MDSAALRLSNFSANEVDELIEKAIDWAFVHGLCIRSKTNFTRNSIQFFPFILLPSPFPRKEFDNARWIQTTLNILIHRVAQDHDFLSGTLKETIQVDDFTKRLFEIYEIVRSEGGSAQKISLGILRSDLMLDTCCLREDRPYSPYCCWKQVEINTIASGCGGVGPLTRELHRYVLGEIGCQKDLEKSLPQNDSLQVICSCIIDAWKMYGDEQGVILFVVEDVTYNICDQRLHEFEIRKQNPDVKVVRRSLTQLSVTARLGSRRELMVDGNYVVSVVYYRSGYEPGQYPTEKEWETRLLIERSLAIKCPTIQYHLAGTKKVQQVLAKPGVVCKFLENEQTECAEINKIFTGLYALDFDEHGEAAIEMGIANPDKFVLKPQREGGSNNKYGSDVKHFLESVKNQRERVAWILMDKIYPPIHDSYMIRPDEDHVNGELRELVSELGIFGVIIADDENVYINKQGGHMLRTKLATANEGGVSTGLAVPEVIHAVAKYEVEREPREIFFFEEGTVVMWNVSELECENILDFLKKYEQSRYMDYIVQSESEEMRYSYTEDGKQSHLRNGIIMIAANATNLDKYTFSNAMAQSVKLGIWEASLDNYIDSIEFVTEDLKAGRKLRMTQQEVLRKQGELFKLRHSINLSSDLLDTPDFYWDRDDLERVYQETCSYFNIAKRTRVINEKLNHCVELVAILSTHLSDRHHVRLEWMIIILIMVEVAFEILHYVDKYFS